MKLGTLKNNTRDGELVVVSKDNTKYVSAADIAPNLQTALDSWGDIAPKLENLYTQLSSGEVSGKTFDSTLMHSPLPRAYEWLDGSAYINHVVLVRKARNAEPPATLKTDPLMYQGGSGVFLAPNEDIKIADEAWGLDFESEVCVVLDDVPQGTSKDDALKHVKLIMIVNDVSLRNLIPDELKKGFGFLQSKPASAFSPICITPDELGDSWQEGRVHLPLKSWYNGELFGDPESGPEMHFSFADLIHHITKTRSLTAGTILGSGTVSNEDRARGSSCLAEKRMIEKIDSGEFKTPFMKAGDKIEIEMFDRDGNSIFGRISQDIKGM